MRATLSDAANAFMKLIIHGSNGRVLGAPISVGGGRWRSSSPSPCGWARRKRFRRDDGVHPTMAEELVTMRAPSRLLRPQA
jgi:glutathione reductase (NADPH)